MERTGRKGGKVLKKKRITVWDRKGGRKNGLRTEAKYISAGQREVLERKREKTGLKEIASEIEKVWKDNTTGEKCSRRRKKTESVE